MNKDSKSTALHEVSSIRISSFSGDVHRHVGNIRIVTLDGRNVGGNMFPDRQETDKTLLDRDCGSDKKTI
jgi:hypothetical protein